MPCFPSIIYLLFFFGELYTSALCLAFSGYSYAISLWTHKHFSSVGVSSYVLDEASHNFLYAFCLCCHVLTAFLGIMVIRNKGLSFKALEKQEGKT